MGAAELGDAGGPPLVAVVASALTLASGCAAVALVITAVDRPLHTENGDQSECHQGAGWYAQTALGPGGGSQEADLPHDGRTCGGRTQHGGGRVATDSDLPLPGRGVG